MDAAGGPRDESALRQRRRLFDGADLGDVGQWGCVHLGRGVLFAGQCLTRRGVVRQQRLEVRHGRVDRGPVDDRSDGSHRVARRRWLLDTNARYGSGHRLRQPLHRTFVVAQSAGGQYQRAQCHRRRGVFRTRQRVESVHERRARGRTRPRVLQCHGDLKSWSGKLVAVHRGVLDHRHRRDADRHRRERQRDRHVYVA